MPGPREWMVLVPPRLRPTKDQLGRMQVHMERLFPDMRFTVSQAAWNGDEITTIPCMGRVGDGIWEDKPDAPTDGERRMITQAAGSSIPVRPTL